MVNNQSQSFICFKFQSERSGIGRESPHGLFGLAAYFVTVGLNRKITVSQPLKIVLGSSDFVWLNGQISLLQQSQFSGCRPVIPQRNGKRLQRFILLLKCGLL